LSDRDLEQRIESAGSSTSGPPPLRPFGLVLWRDARWSHEGQPILNRKLRERFDRSVVYLPEQRVYVVEVGRFRGMIEVEETGFFVRDVDLERGEVSLSDGSVEPLDVSSLSLSPIDGAFLCRIKTGLVADGVPARWLHGPQAELLGAVEEQAGRAGLPVAGEWMPLPEAVVGGPPEAGSGG